jgi:hypothetical protein
LFLNEAWAGELIKVRRRNGALKALGDDRRRRSNWAFEA